MQTNIVRRLQHLKKSIEREAQSDFSQLEGRLLDILHRQRLYPDQETLRQEQDEVFHQLEILANHNSQKALIEHYTIPTNSPALTRYSDNSLISFTKSTSYGSHHLAFPKPTITFLTKFVPTSYCAQQDENSYPLITLHFDNRYAETDYSANITVSFHDYSDPAKKTVNIPAGSRLSIPFLPLIRIDHLQKLKEQCPVTLDVIIDYTSPFIGRFTATEILHFFSRRTALLWRCNEDGALIDCTPYLAAWVTPNHPRIEKLANVAARRISGNILDGYNVVGDKEMQALAIHERVKAIFDVLHEQGIVYVPLPKKVQAASDYAQKVQHVRLPSEVLQVRGSANCLDGTVLFASLLEHINLHPVLFLRTGHALVGWRVFRDEPKDKVTYGFLETTLIHTGDFQQACQKGQAEYQQAHQNNILGKSIIEGTDYAHLIEIATCRTNNIQPME